MPLGCAEVASAGKGIAAMADSDVDHLSYGNGPTCSLKTHVESLRTESRFIVPKNLPAEAREGRVYMRKSKQQLDLQKQSLQSERKSVPLQQELVSSSKIGRNEEERFKNGSALNLQFKTAHEKTKSSSEEVIKINKKTGTAWVTSPSDPYHESALISPDADSTTLCLPVVRENEVPTTSVLNQHKNTQSGAPSEILLDPKYIVHLGRKNRQCPKCPYFTYNEVMYMAHLKLHNKNSRAHKCRHCGAYLSLKGMYTHVAKMHPNAVRQDNIPVNQETATFSNLEGSKIVKCKMCKKSFKNESYLHLHFKKQHGHTNTSSDDIKMCDERNLRTTTSTSAKYHESTLINTAVDSMPSRMKANVSTTVDHKLRKTKQEVVRRKVTLKRSYHVHKGIKCHRCLKCAYYTMHRKQFLTHLKLHDKNLRTVRCRHCGAYIAPQGTGMHVAKMHPEAI
ncbi:unnamed protein product [Orchesella dallaii]|uniref:C2H2-type domain-containing protein n=1 Tax=Orchesella dallaii TaxID=48710 RepID=A0ABP1PS61_9HEXA